MTMIEKECEGHCPNCGGSDIDWGRSDGGDGWMSYFGRCSSCGCDVEEQSNLVYSISIGEIPDEDPSKEPNPGLFSDNQGGT